MAAARVHMIRAQHEGEVALPSGGHREIQIGGSRARGEIFKTRVGTEVCRCGYKIT